MTDVIERMKLLYTKKEAAHSLGVSTRTIDNIIARGDLMTKRIGKRVLIPRAVLVKYAASDHPEASAGAGRPSSNRAWLPNTTQ